MASYSWWSWKIEIKPPTFISVQINSSHFCLLSALFSSYFFSPAYDHLLLVKATSSVVAFLPNFCNAMAPTNLIPPTLRLPSPVPITTCALLFTVMVVMPTMAVSLLTRTRTRYDIIKTPEGLSSSSVLTSTFRVVLHQTRALGVVWFKSYGRACQATGIRK